MNDIQRWYIQNPPGQPTEFVSYEDHIAVLRACEQRIREAVEKWFVENRDEMTWPEFLSTVDAMKEKE